MIEMLGVLAIIGVLSAGGVWGYNAAMTQYQVNQTIEDIQDMAVKASTVFSGKTPATRQNIFLSSLIQVGVVPEKYRTGKALFNTPITVYFIDGDLNRPIKTLAIRFRDIPKNICAKIVSFHWLNSFTNSYAISDDKWREKYGKNSGKSELPLSHTDAKTYCDNTTFITLYLHLITSSSQKIR